MSILRKVLKNTMTFNTVRNTTAPKLNTIGEEAIYKWISTLTQKASTPEAKGSVAQLSSLVNFYNRKADQKIPSIDWNFWKDNISTEGLVDKVKANYTEIAKEEYQVEPISKQVINSQSKDLEEIENELSFHGAVWMNVYADYKMFLFELEEYGDPNDYLMHENYDFFNGLEAELEELTETHNYIAGSKDDVNLRAYLGSQFAWGKKVISFYRHPSDDFKCGKATKNILGR